MLLAFEADAEGAFEDENEFGAFVRVVVLAMGELGNMGRRPLPWATRRRKRGWGVSARSGKRRRSAARTTENVFWPRRPPKKWSRPTSKTMAMRASVARVGTSLPFSS